MLSVKDYRNDEPAPVGTGRETTLDTPVRLSDALLASAAREAKIALANGWREARYDIDRATGEGRR